MGCQPLPLKSRLVWLVRSPYFKKLVRDTCPTCIGYSLVQQHPNTMYGPNLQLASFGIKPWWRKYDKIYINPIGMSFPWFCDVLIMHPYAIIFTHKHTGTEKPSSHFEPRLGEMLLRQPAPKPKAKESCKCG